MIQVISDFKTEFREPVQYNNRKLLQDLALEVVAQEASDLFLTSDRQIIIEVHGRMHALTDRRISTDEILQLVNWATGKDGESSNLAQGEEVVGSYIALDPSKTDRRGEKLRHRFRVNATRTEYRGQLGVQMVMRAIKSEPPLVHTLGLDDALLTAMTPRTGIVYMTGATGSGKTTTFAGIVRHILEGDTPIKGNINTYESPIEFVYDTIESTHSIIAQSEVPRDIKSFSRGIRSSMRRHPALIVIGETRDWDTASASVEASTTGHPVFTTLHASDVKSIPSRLLSLAPPDQQNKALYDILTTAQVMVNQVLVPSLDGRRTPLREYLIVTEDLRDELLRVANPSLITSKVGDMLQECGKPMARAAMEALEKGLISEEVALTFQPKVSR